MKSLLTRLFRKPPPDEIVILESDPYDRAYRWAWNEGGMKELVRLCYKSPDFADNARRFYASDEFAYTLQELSMLGIDQAGGGEVLDFGCGNGVAAYALARSGFTVTAVDSSPGLLAGLGAAAQLNGLDGAKINLQEHSGELLSFRDNSFDVVYIREVLHHIQGLKEFLMQIKRILKPSGVLCCLRDVVIWNEAQREHFFANHPLYPITKDEGCYYLEEYEAAFHQSGLHLRKTLHPNESVINAYPTPFSEPTAFDVLEAKKRETGYDLFSFFAIK